MQHTQNVAADTLPAVLQDFELYSPAVLFWSNDSDWEQETPRRDPGVRMCQTSGQVRPALTSSESGKFSCKPALQSCIEHSNFLPIATM